MNEDKKSTSQKLMDDLEPIINHPRRKVYHPTEHDESDDIEAAKSCGGVPPGFIKKGS
tara:strand:+ start:593 stop:766 length:174 start_codon:yes stop_codon:yes gene_type:complete